MTNEQFDLLEIRLREALYDEVPTDVADAAKALFGLRDFDAKVAELIFDSATAQAAGVRGVTATRDLTFVADDAEIELSAEPDGSAVGQVMPPGAVAIDLVSPSGVSRLRADDQGRFRIERLPSGPFCIRVTMAEGTKIRTPWLLA